jgi:hypothetical protein
LTADRGLDISGGRVRSVIPIIGGWAILAQWMADRRLGHCGQQE